MATLGSTAEPTTGAVYFGLNSTNHHAILLTLPSGGPWEISRVGAWCAGMNETANVKVCVWSAGGSLLGQTAAFSLAGPALGIGNSTKAEGNLTTPVVVAGGTAVYVGIARDPQDNTQFSTRSGTRLDKTSSSWPASLSGGSTVSGAIGAYIADYHSANVAPNAPVSLDPTGNEVVNTGRTITYKGTRSDPDSGDYITGFEVQVWNDGHTTLLQSGSYDLSGTPTTFSKSLTLPSGYNADRLYDWRARTKDSGGLWGPWSAYQGFRANSPPNTPSAPTVDTDTLAPTIGGSFSDPDPGATLAAVQVEVERVSPAADMWVSADIAKTAAPWTTVYAGSVLAWGTAYRARYRTKDQYGAYSAWGAWRDFTPVQPVGPSNLTPRTESPRQSTLVPTLTVGHSSTFRNDEVEVYAANSLTSTKLWTKSWDAVDYAAVATKARPYGTGGTAATALAWGTTYYWRARIEDAAGVVSLWSNLVPFRTNALPTASVVTVTNPDGTAPPEPGGVAVVTAARPILVAPFEDPDLEAGDTPGARVVEVRRKDTQAALAGYPVTVGLTPSHTLATDLVLEVTYEARFGWRDAAGQPAGTYVYTAWRELRRSTAPTVALVAPAAGGTVPESTPLLDWTYASVPGKAQAAHQVVLSDLGPLGSPIEEVVVHDSGLLGGPDTAYTVPAGIIANGRQYRWTVTVVDSDGLQGVLT